MKPDTIRAAVESKKAQDANKRVAQLEKLLATTVAAVERQRRARKVTVQPAKRMPRLRGDTIRMIACDVHGAKMARPAVSAFLRDAKQLNPQELILNGDIIDCGGFLAQHHVMGYVAETAYSYEGDIAAANGFLDGVQSAAPNAVIDFIEGNHCRRVETWCVTETLRHGSDGKFLLSLVGPEALLKLSDRGIHYRRSGECHDGLSVPGIIKRGKCYFHHGVLAAKNAAAATQVGMAGNIVFAHTHRAQSDIVRKVGVGVVGSWNPGCLCEMQPLWCHGRHTDWTHGYAVQFVSHTGKFLHLNIPIINGVSLFTSAFAPIPLAKAA
jgi:hypothetical protein